MSDKVICQCQCPKIGWKVSPEEMLIELGRLVNEILASKGIAVEAIPEDFQIPGERMGFCWHAPEGIVIFSEMVSEDASMDDYKHSSLEMPELRDELLRPVAKNVAAQLSARGKKVYSARLELPGGMEISKGALVGNLWLRMVRDYLITVNRKITLINVVFGHAEAQGEANVA